jgi:hypothetical protein
VVADFDDSMVSHGETDKAIGLVDLCHLLSRSMPARLNDADGNAFMARGGRG